MSAPAAGSPQAANRLSWQDKLKDHCMTNSVAAPVFHIVSDRRGGRTAWSATVDVAGRNFAARYWYDGQYINNAKEDASEVAIMALKPLAFAPQTSYQGQVYP